MRKKYTIYHGGKSIVPADDSITQIYHGSTLIWERAAGCSISEAFADTAIYGATYVFTKSGLLIPRSFDQDTDSLTVFSLTGATSSVSVSSYHVSGKTEDWQYVYADTPMYYDAVSRDLLVFSSDLVSASRISWAYSSYTATQSQAQAAFAKYGTSAKASTAAKNYSGYAIYPGAERQAHGGIVPFGRFVAVDKTAEDVVFLSGVKDGILQVFSAEDASSGYIILDATASGLICAENPALDTSLQINCQISLRDFSGTFLKYLTDDTICIFNAATTSAYQYPSRCFSLAGDLRYIPNVSAPYEWEKAGGTIWCAHPGSVPATGGSYVTADGAQVSLAAEGISYSLAYASAAGGYHYCDDSGARLYIMVSDDAGRTDEDGNDVGIVLKIKKG